MYSILAILYPLTSEELSKKSDSFLEQYANLIINNDRNRIEIMINKIKLKLHDFNIKLVPLHLVFFL